MFPCQSPATCGIMWHAHGDAPLCASLAGIGRALGSPHQAHTAWDKKMLDQARRNEPSLDEVARGSISVVHVERTPEGAWEMATTVRSLDATFSVHASIIGTQMILGLQAQRTGAPNRALWAQLRSASQSPASTTLAGMPDVFEVVGGPHAWKMASTQPPSVCDSIIGAADRYNEGRNWAVTSADGTVDWLDADTHAIVTAMRKVSLGLLAHKTECEGIDILTGPDREVGAGVAKDLMEQTRSIARRFGVVAVGTYSRLGAH